jgi:hypothetical protein
LADEQRLNFGQPDVIGPAIGAQSGRVEALMVGAVDQQPANARSAHFAEGDFLNAISSARYPPRYPSMFTQTEEQNRYR